MVLATTVDDGQALVNIRIEIYLVSTATLMVSNRIMMVLCG